MNLEDVFNFFADMLDTLLGVGQFLTSELEGINMAPIQLFLGGGIVVVLTLHLIKLGFR